MDSAKKSTGQNSSRRKSRDAAGVHTQNTSMGFAIKENRNSIANRTLNNDELSAIHNFSTIGLEGKHFFNDRS